MNAHAKSTFGFSKLKDSKAMHDFATSTTYTCTLIVAVGLKLRLTLFQDVFKVDFSMTLLPTFFINLNPFMLLFFQAH